MLNLVQYWFSLNILTFAKCIEKSILNNYNNIMYIMIILYLMYVYSTT
jgi:hypothetical protein